jgi:hypothetical protein
MRRELGEKVAPSKRNALGTNERLRVFASTT